MLVLIFNLCIYLALINSGHAQKLINDSCVLQNGKQGKCQRFENCSSAIDLVRSRTASPENCGFDGRHPIVCCEIKAQLQQRSAGEISKQKCKEWYSSPLRRSRATVAGGEDAQPKEFPHMAVLGYGDQGAKSWGCGGSLISEKFVLTAAHCIHSRQFGDVKYVRVGDLDLNSTTDIAKPQDYNVLKWTVHPKYRAPSVYHDIALIELSSNAVIDDFVRPACLFTEATIPTQYLTVTGWGLTSFLGVQATHLQEAYLRTYTFEKCRDSYKSTSKSRLANGIDNNMHICAGERGRDTCEGDSGGPLQFKNIELPWGYSIVGVTSFGKACGIGNTIAVYVRVSLYIDWIESIVWP